MGELGHQGRYQCSQSYLMQAIVQAIVVQRESSEQRSERLRELGASCEGQQDFAKLRA